MKYNTKTIDITLTPAITEYLDKKLSHLDTFISASMQESLMCYVEVGKTTNHHKTGDIFMTEITIHSGASLLHAKAEEQDLYASIDVATEEMARILKSFKGKKQNLFKKGGAKIKTLLKKFSDADEQ